MNDATSILTAHDSVLVHCASFQPLVGSPLTEPLLAVPLQRLRRVIDTRPDVCFSTIASSDCFDDGKGRRNFTGQIGLIVAPHGLSSITMAQPTDGGSQAPSDLGGRSFIARPVIDAQAELDAAIQARAVTDSNEICLHPESYDVLGVFFDRPRPTFMIGSAVVSVSEAEIAEIFPDQRLYLFHAGKLFEVALKQGSGSFYQVAAGIPLSSIYQ